ncbi:MAG: T9SS type A sorting domain-containing protein, partial [Bacteroidota bacterium]
PINLSFLQNNDTSVYLSFFYQTRGWGDPPETADSLVVEILRSSDTTWNKLWARAGFNPGTNDSTWRFVLLKIPSNAGYYTNDFQFRFRNRATLSGSLDHWHVDYIYLNAGRTKSDSSFKDIAFGYQAPSILRNYSSIPFWQFNNSGDIVSSFPVFIRNNDTTTAASNFAVKLEVFDTLNNPILPQVSPGNFNIDNWEIGGWDNYPPHCNQNISIPVPSGMSDSGTYKTKLFITPNDFNFDQNWNDTLIGYHHFSNYYSFDDGTAESGYGLNQYGSMMAVKINLNVADSLKAVDIYFDPIINIQSVLNSTYTIWVWNDNNGVPGDSVYADTLRNPVFYNNQFQNAFKRDTLMKSIYLNPGAYYVGFKQTGNLPLNVGFDRNYNHQDRMFYNTNGTWQNSSFKGSYMIRPVFGKYELGQGIKFAAFEDKKITVYPNPTESTVVIKINQYPNNEIIKLSIFNCSGEIISERIIKNNDQVDFSNFETGIYLIRASDNKGNFYTTKIILHK